MILTAVREASDVYCGLQHVGSMSSTSPALSYSTLSTTL